MSDFYCEEVFSGKTEVNVVKERDKVLAFYHTNPSYELHIVIVPKKHIITLLDSNSEILTEIFDVAKEIIQDLGLNKTNYKVIVNGGSFQESQHLHFHLISGQKRA